MFIKRVKHYHQWLRTDIPLKTKLGQISLILSEFTLLAFLIVQVSVKDGEDFFLKKGTSKDAQGFGPYQNKPFRGPHNKKSGSNRKRPYGGIYSQNSNQSFSSGRGKPNFRGSKGHFQPHSRGLGHGNPSSNNSSKASLSPPEGGHLRSFRRDWQTNKCSNNVLNIITDGYVLSFISKPNLELP